METIWDRLIKNWKTTMTALIPAAVVIAGWLGLDIDPTKLSTVAAAFYAVVLVISKDAPKAK